jgi:hypothetical protein
MTLKDHARSAFRTLERLAEALEPDPLEDLRRRVARLERQALGDQASPTAPIDREQTADRDG